MAQEDYKHNDNGMRKILVAVYHVSKWEEKRIQNRIKVSIWLLIAYIFCISICKKCIWNCKKNYVVGYQVIFW